MTLDVVRVGIIGAGANTKKMHIPKLQELDGVEIVSVCNRSQESGQRVAEQFGIPNVCSEWREMMDDDQIGTDCSYGHIDSVQRWADRNIGRKAGLSVLRIHPRALTS